MVPIHKRGNYCDPANHRPIALLSHGRQMVSGAIGELIRAQYKFHPNQLGFRENTGTETAIVRHSFHYHKGLKYTAVLDLKSAYDSVPRDILMERVRSKLPKQTADMIALELQPITIFTKGDTSGTTAEVSIGVPQGGKSSPPLFNLQMDTFVEKIDEAKSRWAVDNDQPESKVEVTTFPDDAQLHSDSRKVLQAALNVCTEWAKETKAIWNVKKCHVLEPEEEAAIRS